MPCGDEALHEQRTEVSGSAGDQARGRCPGSHSCRPCSTHQRMLSAHAFVELDLRLVAELTASHGDVAGDRVIHLAEHVELLLVAAKTLDDTVTELGHASRDRGQPSLIGGFTLNPSSVRARPTVATISLTV